MGNDSELTFSLATVVSPSDNADSFRLMLNSLLLQNKKLDEYHFVINGIVPNQIRYLCDEFKSRIHSNVIFHHNNEVKSLSECLNYIVKSSKCSILVRLDPDDFALPDRFESLMSIFLKKAPDVYFSNSIFYDGSKIWWDKRVLFTDIKQALDSLKYYNPFIHSSAAFNRYLLQRHGGYPEIKFAEDYSLWLSLKNKSVNFYFESRPLVIYNFKNVLSRRSSLELFKSEFLLFKLKCKQSHKLKTILIYFLRILYLLSPIYLKLLFSKINRLEIKNQTMYLDYVQTLTNGPIQHKVVI